MSKIKVALRVRPLSTREKEENHVVVVGLENKSAFITDIKVPERPSADSRQRLRQFDFDHVFWLSQSGQEGATQNSIYAEMGPDLEKSILTGHNATILCYGQSGTGKTHSMLGTKEDPGLIPRLCQSLWDKLKGQETRKSTFLFEVSFMEIYREKVRDLLTHSEKILKLREHPTLGPHVQGLTRITINEQWEFLNLLWEGERRRAIGSTGSNRRSSRSHAIWTLYLTSSIKSDSEKGSGLITRTNQVHLVDLAGSEKADLITTKNLLAEGKDINRSLVTLGNVISSLAEKANYIPYRNSTLTFLLKDSLGGNSSTSIIITASPASCCHAQTLNSFRFAQRARLVENQPKVNIFHQVNESSGIYGSMSGLEFRKDISKLASIIRSAQNNGGILRGLTPRHSWNRLITAIENWNHNDRQAMDKHHEFLRTASLDTSTTTTSTSTSTMTSSFSSDAMVQAEIKDEDCGCGATTASSSSTSVKSSPSKIMGTEVFIPCSSTVKCLTWKQEEIHKLPQNQSSDSSDSDFFVSPATSPTNDSKISQLKYLLQVHYPTSHCLSSESRIAEKIHGSVDCKNMTNDCIQLTPIEVQTEVDNFPIVREKFPTLVGQTELEHEFDEFSQDEISSVPSCSENSSNSSNSSYENINFTESRKSNNKNYIVTSTPTKLQHDDHKHCKNIQGNVQVPQFGFKIPNVSEFTKSRPILITPLESTDEFEQEDLLSNDDNSLEDKNSVCKFGKYRAISFNKSPKLVQEKLINSNNDGQEALCFSQSNSNSSCSSSSLSSSSSYESLVVKPPSMKNKVKVVENGIFDFKSVEEKIDENLIVNPANSFETHTANIYSIENNYKEPNNKSPPTNLPTNEKQTNNAESCNSTKFRTHFMKELHEMELIGKQIQNLQQMTNRHHIVKPYLDKVIKLQCMDHTKPDPVLDAEIEECSGWNIGIELAKVQKDIFKLNKLLKVGPKKVASENSSMEHSIQESTLSSRSVSQDSCSQKSTPNSSNSTSNSNSNSTSSNGSSRRSSNTSNIKPSPSTSLSSNKFNFQLQKENQTPTSARPRKLFSSQVVQPSQSWNLQFPLSSAHHHQQPQQIPPHEYYQFHSQPPPPFNYSSCVQNPFTVELPSNSTGRTTTFQNFHSQAGQRLAQKWQPILPKTHDYLQQQRLHHTYYDTNECAGSGNDYIGNISHFHPYHQSTTQIHNNTTNPALLYPTNFPLHHHQPQPHLNPYDLNNQVHVPCFSNYQTLPVNPAVDYQSPQSQYDSIHFPLSHFQSQRRDSSSQFDESTRMSRGHSHGHSHSHDYSYGSVTNEFEETRQQLKSSQLLKQLQSMRKQIIES